MEKRFTLLIIVPFLFSVAQSQTVAPTIVSGNGGYSQSPQGSLAWTIGEPISETYTSSTNITTMGFHQPEELALTTLIKEQGDEKAILVYPNPVQNELTVNFGTVQQGNYLLELVDGLGKLLLATEVPVTEQSKRIILSLNTISIGVYYLKISRDAFSKTIKINKIN